MKGRARARCTRARGRTSPWPQGRQARPPRCGRLRPPWLRGAAGHPLGRARGDHDPVAGGKASDPASCHGGGPGKRPRLFGADARRGLRARADDARERNMADPRPATTAAGLKNPPKTGISERCSSFPLGAAALRAASPSPRAAPPSSRFPEFPSSRPADPGSAVHPAPEASPLSAHRCSVPLASTHQARSIVLPPPCLARRPPRPAQSHDSSPRPARARQGGFPQNLKSRRRKGAGGERDGDTDTCLLCTTSPAHSRNPPKGKQNKC